MLVDFDTEPLPAFEPDVVVVGGGTIGLTTAHALAQRRHRVLLLEGGGSRDEPHSQDLYRAQSTGRLNSGVFGGRFRVFGGSSTRWGAQLLPLEDEDFQPRAAVPLTGWPIERTQVDPHLPAALRLLGVGGSPWDDSLTRNGRRRWPGASSGVLKLRYTKWAPWGRRNLRETLGHAVADMPNALVCLHANAVELLRAEGASCVDRLRVRSFAGREVIIPTKRLVLAAGALENPRLLLASPTVLAVGEQSWARWVGACFQDHLSIRFGRILPRSRGSFLRAVQPFFEGKVMRSAKFLMSAEEQRRIALPGAAAHVAFGLAPGSPLEVVRSLLRGRQRGQATGLPFERLAAVARAFPEALEAVFARAFLGVRPVPASSTPYLQIDVEPVPRWDSRVSLSSRTDALGMPQLIVNWIWGEEEMASARHAARLWSLEFESSGLGHVELDDALMNGAEPSEEVGYSAYHHGGTTRMGQSSAHGVVDVDLRLHGSSNTYVTGCSVFPTIGCGHPTLTAMALSLRLADHIDRQIAGSRS